MEQLRDILRLGHIALGFLGLVIFWVPIVAKKGASVHVAAGKIFTFAVYLVTTSAVINWVILMTSRLPLRRAEGNDLAEGRGPCPRYVPVLKRAHPYLGALSVTPALA